MSPVLAAVLLACGTGLVSAFVAYWLGRGPVEKQLRTVQARYALMTQTSIDLAVALNHLKRHHGYLTADEAAAFADIANHYGKETA